MPTDTHFEGSESELGRSQGSKPSDTEALPGDTAASRPLVDEERRAQPPESDSRPDPGRAPSRRDPDEGPR